MKYQNEIIVDLPRDQFVEKLNNPDNMKHWMKGLLDHKQLEGTPGDVGAKMHLHFKTGKREMTMTETILKNDFPKAFHANYEANGVLNIQENVFEAVSPSKTKWISKNEFQFSSFGMKVFGFLMPGVFKKQSMSYLKAFKDFAENGTSLVDGQS